MTALRCAGTRLGAAGVAALTVLVLLLVTALLSPWIAPYAPQVGSILDSYASPSRAHWLGTDANGFDVLSRLMLGARTSLLGPAAVILLSLLVGLPLGLAAAWRGGWLDTLVSRTMDIVFAMPGLLFAVLAAASIGPGLRPAVVAIAISYLPYVARVVRSAALHQRVQPYVSALEVQGVSGLAICVRHLLPNIAGIVLAQATIAFGYALADLAALSFLGLAVQAPQPDWGVLVNDETGLRNGHSTQILAASILIVLTVAALAVLGDRLAGDRAATIHRRSRRRPARVRSERTSTVPATDRRASSEVLETAR